MMIKKITKTIMILWVLGILLFLGSSCLVSDAFLNELLYGTESPPDNTETQTINVTGTYYSEYWGEIVLKQDGNQVTGTYGSGTIEGTVTGDTLEGTWEGAYSSGRLRVKFASDASRFEGYYSSGSEDPSPGSPSGEHWIGTRTAAAPDEAKEEPPVVATPQPEPVAPKSNTAVYVPPTGLDVTGVYRTSMGELTLIQSGNEVSGAYPQSTLEGTMSDQVLTGNIFSLGTTAEIKFTFAADGSYFQGAMYYQGSTHMWNGTRISRTVDQSAMVEIKSPQQADDNNTQSIAKTPQSTLTIEGTYYSEYWGEIVLKQDGNRITGTYRSGTIEGTVTGDTLEGTWEGAYSSGRLRVKFASDASRFEGYYSSGSQEPSPESPSGEHWTGIRTSAPLDQSKQMPVQQSNNGSIEDLYGGWLDIDETMSGFVFNPDTTLLMFSDGEIFEGYWESDGKELTLFAESAQGDYITFEGSYTYDGKNLHVYMDGYELILEEHWVVSIDDIHALFEQSDAVVSTNQGTQGFSIAGTYDTNFGKMILHQTGNSITGEYPLGKAVGTLSGQQFSGTFESMNTVGTFNLTFSNDASEFTGRMIVDVYTDYLWEGKRISKDMTQAEQTPQVQAAPAQNVQSVYEIGMRGPAGGFIFYDKGEYSDGWQYLEAAPPDAEMIKPWAPNTNIHVGVYDDAIGAGETNTTAIARNYTNNVDKTALGDYAPTACDALVYGGYDDWFLPSALELASMFTELHKEGLGGFSKDFYWASNEYDASADFYAFYIHFDIGSKYIENKTYALRVRPARAF